MPTETTSTTLAFDAIRLGLSPYAAPTRVNKHYSCRLWAVALRRGARCRHLWIGSCIG